MAVKSKKQRQVTTVINYKAVFTTDDGKRVLWDLMKAANFLDASPCTDGISYAYNEGRRSVVLDILKKIKVDVVQLQEFLDKNIENDRIYTEQDRTFI